MKKGLLLTLFVVVFCASAQAVTMVTDVVYAERDSALKMDIYLPDDTLSKHLCLIYVFGGGFTHGERNGSHIVSLLQEVSSKCGIVCVAIDYRLGLKGYVYKNALDALPKIEEAINMATVDVMSATRFLYVNADKYKIDKDLIMASGSSSGAMSVLQADYYLHSENPMANVLPEGFKYAGILSFSGAVTLFKNDLKYTSQPAPTLFIHGTKDKLVSYKKMVIFGYGTVGSNDLAELFKKNGWRYEIVRYENFGHEVAWIGFKENIPEIKLFIDRFVLDKGYVAKYGASLDITHKESWVKEPLWNADGLDYYKKSDNMASTQDSVIVKRLEGF